MSEGRGGIFGFGILGTRKERGKTGPPVQEDYATITDPTTNVEIRVSRDEMWKLMFAAAGTYCSGQASRGGKRNNQAFIQCMHSVTVGRYRELDVQRFVNSAEFPVEEFIRGIR